VIQQCPTLTKIWIHIICTPKNREHLIKSESEEKVFDIIRQEFNAIECYLEIINGMPDHAQGFNISPGFNPGYTKQRI
jgi:REP element-mobilizing transposase RayT